MQRRIYSFIFALFALQSVVFSLPAFARQAIQQAHCDESTGNASSSPRDPAHYFPEVESAFQFPQSNDRRTVPAVTVWRERCSSAPGELQVWMRWTNTRSPLYSAPTRVFVEQNAKVLGCFGPACKEFSFNAQVTKADSITGALLATTAGAGFDPGAAFRMRFTYYPHDEATMSVVDVPAITAPGNITLVPEEISGIWHNPSEPGWGVALERNERGTVFAAWLTFGDNGQPTWFVMPYSEGQALNVVKGAVYQPNGPPLESAQFTGAEVGPVIGSFTLRFSADSRLAMDYDVLGRSGTMNLERLTVKDSAGQACRGRSGVWLAQQPDSARTNIEGWGIALEGDTNEWRSCALHAVIMTYDAARNPTWFFTPVSAKPTPPNTLPSFIPPPRFYFDGPLYRPTGNAFGRPFDASLFQVGPQIGKWEDARDIVTFDTGRMRRAVLLNRFKFEF